MGTYSSIRISYQDTADPEIRSQVDGAGQYLDIPVHLLNGNDIVACARLSGDARR